MNKTADKGRAPAPSQRSLTALLREVRACRVCEAHLPLGPRPVVRVHTSARILVVGQAPGTAVHASGIPWDDPSGDRLRTWMGLDRAAFYDERTVAVIPMGYCYPGKGKGGDLPPRPECAALWLPRLLDHLPRVEFTILCGQYAIGHYLKGRERGSLTETVLAWRSYMPRYFPAPHPSPRNFMWRARNPWFEAEAVPVLRERVRGILEKGT